MGVDDANQESDGAIFLPAVNQEKVYSDQSAAAVEILHRLDQSGFDHKQFITQVRQMKSRLIDDGSFTFIPLVWGMPMHGDPGVASQFDGNSLVIDYSANNRLSLPFLVLPEDFGDDNWINSGFSDKRYTRPAVMTEQAISERVTQARAFTPCVISDSTNELNDHHGALYMTDGQGNLYISLNSPTDLRVAEGGKVRDNNRVPTPFDGS